MSTTMLSDMELKREFRWSETKVTVPSDRDLMQSGTRKFRWCETVPNDMELKRGGTSEFQREFRWCEIQREFMWHETKVAVAVPSDMVLKLGRTEADEMEPGMDNQVGNSIGSFTPNLGQKLA